MASAGGLPSFHVPMIGCPIEATMDPLGHKWSMIILRDIVFFGRTRFRDYLAANEGLTPRVLSRRLKELVHHGLIQRVERGDAYELTQKGRDTVPILTALFHYGAMHRPSQVFADSKPHSLREVFPGQQRTLLGPLWEYAKHAK